LAEASVDRLPDFLLTVHGARRLPDGIGEGRAGLEGGVLAKDRAATAIGAEAELVRPPDRVAVQRGDADGPGIRVDVNFDGRPHRGSRRRADGCRVVQHHPVAVVDLFDRWEEAKAGRAEDVGEVVREVLERLVRAHALQVALVFGCRGLLTWNRRRQLQARQHLAGFVAGVGLAANLGHRSIDGPVGGVEGLLNLIAPRSRGRDRHAVLIRRLVAGQVIGRLAGRGLRGRGAGGALVISG
jgi:hypothetical protein